MHHHQLTTKKLSRERDQRRALLKGLATSLVMEEKVTTTKPKSKLLQPYIERLITKAKQGGLARRRQALAALSTDEAATKLFEDLGKRFAKRAGGYTRIKAAGWRRGDNAELATISFTEQPVAKPAAEPNAKSADRGKDKAKP